MNDIVIDVPRKKTFLSLKTKCSIKIRDKDKFKQPSIHMKARLNSKGLSDFMSPSQVMEATKKFEEYKVAIAEKRVLEKNAKKVEIQKQANEERLREIAEENKKLKGMTEAQKKKYFHDKSHAFDHLNEFKKSDKDHVIHKKPKPLTSDQTFHQQKVELHKLIKIQNMKEVE